MKEILELFDLLPGQTCEQAVEAAEKLINELCSGKRDWTMRVPPQRDYDPDLVINRALRAQARRIEELSTALARTNQDVTVDRQRAVEDERAACAAIVEDYMSTVSHVAAQNVALQIMYKIEARGRNTNGNS